MHLHYTVSWQFITGIRGILPLICECFIGDSILFYIHIFTYLMLSLMCIMSKNSSFHPCIERYFFSNYCQDKVHLVLHCLPFLLLSMEVLVAGGAVFNGQRFQFNFIFIQQGIISPP